MAAHYHEIAEGALRIPVPDVRQRTDWSCGAAALQAVAAYFGVGPQEEADFARDMQIDHRIGAHPHQIAAAAKRYGLNVAEQHEMTDGELRKLIDAHKPVLLMIQAWGDPKTYPSDDDYQGVWKEGHWVVTIGYDAEGFLFEDPSLAAVRGYLTCAGLEKRWRDVGPHGRHLLRLGMAIWMHETESPAYLRRARHIG